MIKIQKTAVIAGCGEIGTPLYKLCCGAYEDVIIEDPCYGKPEAPQWKVAVLHIAFPGNIKDYIKIVSAYIIKYDPAIVLIHSSTVPGCTDEIIKIHGEDRIVHTQVHGKHQGGKMLSDMLRYPKFVATRSEKAFNNAKEALETIGHPPNLIIRLSKPVAGEIAKLLATTFFGYLIVWAQEVERLGKKFDVSYEELMSFTKLNTDDFKIENKFPGVIGGHCVMSNIEILRTCYPSPLWDYMVESNRKKNEQNKN